MLYMLDTGICRYRWEKSMLLLQQMIVLFIYIVIGYAAAKKGIMNEETSKKLSWIVVEVADRKSVV